MDALPLLEVRVLVVEGDDVRTRELGEFLRRHGATVANCRTHAASSAMRPDVVVVDLDEAAEDRQARVEWVRCACPGATMLLLTSSHADDATTITAGLGGTQVLAKPLGPDALLRAVRDAARDARLARLRRAAFTEACARRDAGEACHQLDALLPGLHLAWQPIVSASNGAIVGFEALARAGGSTVGPLLHLAEAAGRMVELGRRLRAMVALDAERLPPDALLFINLHDDELGDDELIGPAEPLARYARRAVLEISQRAASGQAVDAAGRVGALRARGYRVAIDDVGAGYSGLTGIANYSPEFAKLDISLVRGIEGDPARRQLVRAIAAVCAHMAIEVVAKGVETPAELEAVATSGCTLVQGYLVAKPLPIGRLG